MQSTTRQEPQMTVSQDLQKYNESRALQAAAEVSASAKWFIRDLQRMVDKLDAKVAAGDASDLKDFDADLNLVCRDSLMREMTRYIAAVAVVNAEQVRVAVKAAV